MDEARLKQSPLFAGLNRKERQALAPRTDEVDLDQGRVIVREGEWPYEFFAIEQGTVEVRRGDQLLAELGPGDFFGEMGLLGGSPRTADVIAETPLRLIVLSGPVLKELERECPALARRISGAIEQRRAWLQPVP